MTKESKADAHYRPGSRRQRCGLCTMFRPPSSCTKVRGDIAPSALCDYYEAKPIFAATIGNLTRNG